MAGFVQFSISLYFVFLLTTVLSNCSSCFTYPLTVAFSKNVDSPSLCQEVLGGLLGFQGFSKAASPHMFLLSVLKLFLPICWTLREERTFGSNQHPSNSYLKESYRKPWSSQKNLDCLLFIRSTRTVFFGYQAFLKNCSFPFSLLLTVEVNID